MIYNQDYPALTVFSVLVKPDDGINTADIESLIVQNYPACSLKEEFNISGTSNGQVSINAITTPAAECLFRIARYHNLEVTRIGIAVKIPATRQNFITGEYVSVMDELHAHYERIPALSKIKRFRAMICDIETSQFGARTTDQQLLARAISKEDLAVEWRLRGYRAERVYSSLQQDADNWKQGLTRNFCAITNSALGQDWFRIGYYMDEYLPNRLSEVEPEKSKDSIEAIKLYLTGQVAKRITRFINSIGDNEEKLATIIAISNLFEAELLHQLTPTKQVDSPEVLLQDW